MTKPMLRKAGLRSDPRCTLGELCARPSSEGAAGLERDGEWRVLPDLLILDILGRIGIKGGHYWETIGESVHLKTWSLLPGGRSEVRN